MATKRKSRKTRNISSRSSCNLAFTSARLFLFAVAPVILLCEGTFSPRENLVSAFLGQPNGKVIFSRGETKQKEKKPPARARAREREREREGDRVRDEQEKEKLSENEHASVGENEPARDGDCERAGTRGGVAPSNRG